MKLNKYLIDKRNTICLGLVYYLIMVMFFIGFRVDKSLIAAFTILLGGFFLVALTWDFLRRRRFYNMLVEQTKQLDQKYLVLEMLSEPEFYEGEIVYQELYDIHKSMVENINSYRHSVEDFKEYIEMWIHEAKIPIASLVLMSHNNKTTKKVYEQVRRLDVLIDQVLYYVRAENAEKDYLIKEISLKEIVKKVAMYNKDDLLERQIDFNVNVSGQVVSDAKWLEFILNQLVNNGMKYSRTGVQSEIRIYTEELADGVKLCVEDNGIGITPGDLPRVFDKSFTGENGRTKAKSTGMGLYIVKKLCDRIGHGIEITSEWGEGTRVILTFGKNDFYKMI